MLADFCWLGYKEVLACCRTNGFQSVRIPFYFSVFARQTKLSCQFSDKCYQIWSKHKSEFLELSSRWMFTRIWKQGKPQSTFALAHRALTPVPRVFELHSSRSPHGKASPGHAKETLSLFLLTNLLAKFIPNGIHRYVCPSPVLSVLIQLFELLVLGLLSHTHTWEAIAWNPWSTRSTNWN